MKLYGLVERRRRVQMLCEECGIPYATINVVDEGRTIHARF